MTDQRKEEDVRICKDATGGTTRNSYYAIDDENTTAKYMLDSLENKVVVPTHEDTKFNPFVIRHAMTQDMDITTFLMWLQALSPIFSGMIINNGYLVRYGLGFIDKYMFLIILDAIFGFADIMVLHKHEYDVKKLIFPSIWLPPIYMKMRSKLLGEKNLQHIVWIITFIILIIM